MSASHNISASGVLMDSIRYQIDLVKDGDKPRGTAVASADGEEFSVKLECEYNNSVELISL